MRVYSCIFCLVFGSLGSLGSSQWPLFHSWRPLIHSWMRCFGISRVSRVSWVSLGSLGSCCIFCLIFVQRGRSLACCITCLISVRPCLLHFCLIFARRGRVCLAPFVCPHRLVGPPSSELFCPRLSRTPVLILEGGWIFLLIVGPRGLIFVWWGRSLACCIFCLMNRLSGP